MLRQIDEHCHDFGFEARGGLVPDLCEALVTASAAPLATLDFTLGGPIGDGQGEIAVQGGKVLVAWTFTRGRAAQ